MSSKARPESDCSLTSRRGSIETTKADPDGVGTLPAAFEKSREDAKTGRHRTWNDAGPKARPEKEVLGGRAKAEDFKARSQAGAMLRLSRVMKNR